MYQFDPNNSIGIDASIPLQNYVQPMTDPLMNGIRLRRALNQANGLDTSEDDDYIDKWNAITGSNGGPSLVNLLTLYRALGGGNLSGGQHWVGGNDHKFNKPR